MAGKKKNAPKRKNPRAKRRTAQISGVRVTKCIVPSMFRGKMFYHTTLSIAPTAGSVAANVFRLNSVYDPDYTGTGTTVVGWTQLNGMYNRHRVLHATVRATFVNNSATIPLTVFIALNPVTTVGTGITQILAQRHVWSDGLATTSGPCTRTHTIGAPIAAIYGVPAAQVRNEDDFAAVGAAVPNNVAFCHIGAYADGAATGALTMHVSIEFDVVWSLPLEMT